ncbi:MAG: SIR2 family NAD-dependent protein deacylase [Paracoccaceae bacterium]
MKKKLFITGAGVSKSSGIPTFRGADGFWTIGSSNFTPQEMATRKMYCENPSEFLLWYYKRFATYRHILPNEVHFWLADKDLITQNIDGLDGKAGNTRYIPIHGRLDKVTVFHNQDDIIPIEEAPWDIIANEKIDLNDNLKLKRLLLELFKIKGQPEHGHSLKPFVLLFDEYYTDLYRMSEAERAMQFADCVVFMGTSFSVNITSIALRYALSNNAKIEIVDPNPIDLNISGIKYHKMTASEYVSKLNVV